MNFNHTSLPVFFMILLLIGCQDDTRKEDQAYKAGVENIFLSRQEIAKHRKDALFSVFDGNLTEAEEDALKYLFAFMPLNDMADYTGDFFLDQVKISLKSREEMLWGKSIPDDIFRHFVLPYRVNNENLDTFRLVYYDEIKERVTGLTLEEAILEINHWCHEKVSYHAADIRTSSPMNTMKSARGRCGEESTFTVMALRTVSIPARQVYSPRWAHSDDNHAWVEVWLDGSWQFLGACEPAPYFNMGWFKEPARRAMLVHTKAFGLYKGSEPLVKKTMNYGEINSLERYAVTKTLHCVVLDENKLPVDEAEVSFNLYNYAEFYPISTLKSDKNGHVAFMTGLGDLLVWASKNGKFNFDKINVSSVDTIVLVLKNYGISGARYNWDLEPPILREALPVSLEGREENNRRLKEEDFVRTEYIAGFIDSTRSVLIADNIGLEPGKVWEIFRKSEGNYYEIEKYFQSLTETKKAYALDLLDNVSDKDLRDVPAYIFLDHLENSINEVGNINEDNNQLYLKYVLAPRVSNELLTDYRYFLQDAFKKEFDSKPTPQVLIEWINKNIEINETDNYYDVPITPKGVYQLKVSDKYSRKIFFIVLCRSLGIPARLNEVLQIPQFNNQGSWHNVYFTDDKIYSEKTGNISFKNENKNIVPEYYVHFTLAYISDGNYKTLFFKYGKKIFSFPKKISLPVGDYMLVTGNRMGDGSVLNRTTFFSLSEGEDKVLPVKMRESELEESDFGKLNTQQNIQNFEGESVSLEHAISGSEAIVIWIDPDREPTKHVLNDIPLVKESFESWAGKIIFLVPSEKLTASFDPGKFENLPKNSEFYKDPDSKLLKSVSEILKRDVSLNLPLILILDEKIIRYVSEGYKIGIGEQLVKNIKR